LERGANGLQKFALSKDWTLHAAQKSVFIIFCSGFELVAMAGCNYAANAQLRSFLITFSQPRQASATVRGTDLEPLR
jgi:hypothetical protein